jgi:hypothetical protein
MLDVVQLVVIYRDNVVVGSRVVPGQRIAGRRTSRNDCRCLLTDRPSAAENNPPAYLSAVRCVLTIEV